MRLTLSSILISSAAAAGLRTTTTSTSTNINQAPKVLSRDLQFIDDGPLSVIAGYQTGSQVTDHNAIDLDQQAMEVQLALKNTVGFAAGKKIYEEGAFSKSFARITLGSGLTNDIEKGLDITGLSTSGATVYGKALKAFTAGATIIDVQYKTGNDQATYVSCQVGGLPTESATFVGCFANSGNVQIGTSTYVYNYVQSSDNLNGRTIQGFSTQAESKMLTDCPGCPYPTFKKYNDYYGSPSYADEFVLAAIDGTSTSFSNGNAVFSSGIGSDFDLRNDFAKKASAYMNVWMYVIREFEDALDDCKQGCIGCNDDPVHAWDEGVAFYTGSLHGAEADTTSSGTLIYSLANKRCANFKTCGDSNDATTGNSNANIRLFDLFQQGQTELQNGQCDAARLTKNRVEILMSIPLIQGTLRYAYINGPQNARNAKNLGEGAVFAAAVLPLVHHCSSVDAASIYSQVKVGATSIDFSSVKTAFERNYECMGVTCSDIGGYYNGDTNSYYAMAEPCENPPYEDIAGYSPGSQVTDHNALDLDQLALEQQLTIKTQDSYSKAKNIYIQGGNSKSYARLNLKSTLPSSVVKGASILGVASDASIVFGKALATVSSGSSTLDVQYITFNDQASYVKCQVGGLPSNLINTAGCYNNTGYISIAGVGTVEYSYDMLTNNLNSRTIQGFSTQAESKMLTDCPGCPYKTFKKYNDYFGQADYADKMVIAGIDGTSTSFTNGNTDFSKGSANDLNFRTDFVEKTTAYMHVYMYVIREFEDALDDCTKGCIGCNDDPVHAWDEGVAFYTGSSHGEELNTVLGGYFIYSLANKRCTNFKTCGPGNDGTEGNSYVNIELFDLFEKGKNELENGQCDAARVTKDRIEELMPIPIIQGALRYAYITGPQGNREPKALGEGAVFALSVLPLVHACSPTDASTIYNNMKGDATSINYSAVKSAFERNYDCLGIRCEDVGGYYDSANQEYYSLAEPCNAADIPTPAPTDAGVFTFAPGTLCFSGDSVVETLAGEITMESLKIGDKVRTGDKSFETVYSFGHYEKNVEAEYLQIETSEKNKLKISGSHMVITDAGAVPAASVLVGDKLIIGDGSAAEVVAVKTVSAQGAFAPFTRSGKIVVDGIVASNYVSLNGESSIMGFDMQFLAHLSQAPHRIVCDLNFGFCADETYNEKGLSSWIAYPLKIAEWFVSQHRATQVTIFAPAFLLAGFVGLLEFFSANAVIAAAIVGGTAYIGRSRKRKSA